MGAPTPAARSGQRWPLQRGPGLGQSFPGLRPQSLSIPRSPVQPERCKQGYSQAARIPCGRPCAPPRVTPAHHAGNLAAPAAEESEARGEQAGKAARRPSGEGRARAGQGSPGSGPAPLPAPSGGGWTR